MRDRLLLEHILEAIESMEDGDVPPLKSQVEGILKHLTADEQ